MQSDAGIAVTEPGGLPSEESNITRLHDRYLIHVLLFVLAGISSAVVGARLQYNFVHDLPIFGAGQGAAGDAYPLRWILQNPVELIHGVPFSLCLLAFFLTHEFGHYYFCRRHSVDATLPYFLPFPSLVGMLGAVIRIRAPFRDRRVLFDIGVAGPIAGMLVAVPLVVIGLLLSKPLVASAVDPDGLVFGSPLLIWALRWALPRLPLLAQVQPHPVLIAGWVGIFATALNLLPSGQLDGGHIAYAVSPVIYRAVSRTTALALIVMGIFGWLGWLLWGAILLLPAFRHPAVSATPGLSRFQKALAVLAIVIFALTFNPTPFHGQSALEMLPAKWLHR